MAITGALTIIDTDFSDALNGIVSACSPNVLRVTATLSGGTDANSYCKLSLIGSQYEFKMVNKTFNGTTGEFYFDFTDILQYIFVDISDDTLISGVVDVLDIFANLDDSVVDPLTIALYDSADNLLDDIIYAELKLLFSSKQIGNPNGTNEVDWFAGQPVNFLAQKNKQSYIYYYGAGTCTFEKVGNVPEIYAMIDNNEAVMVDNSGDAMINEY